MKNGAAVAAPITSPKRALLCRRYRQCSSDVAPATATTERGVASAIRIAHRVADNAAEARVHLKAGNLIAESLNLVRLNQRTSGFTLGMDRRSNVASILAHLGGQVRRGKPIVAAALRDLSGQVATLRGDGVIKRERAVADSVADVSQAIVDLAKLLAEQNLLLACGGCVLPEFALAVAPEAAASAHEDEQEQDDNPPSTAIIETVITAIDSSSKVRKTVIIQNNHSFQFI